MKRTRVRFPIGHMQDYTDEQLTGIINQLTAARDLPNCNRNPQLTVLDENDQASDYKLFEELNRPKSFEQEIEHSINKHSKEGESNTPDFILAEYLVACLKIFGSISMKRDTWLGHSTNNDKLVSPGGVNLAVADAAIKNAASDIMTALKDENKL